MSRIHKAPFEIIGDIAIVEAKTKKQEKEMIELLHEIYRKRIKTIAKKDGKTGGKFRIKPIKIIWGERRTTTVCRESGCLFSLDLAKVFFSPRLAFERMRIARQIKEGENIIFCFAGVGPFAIIASKYSGAGKIIAIELNKDAFSFMEKNISLNKCKNIVPVLGDVRKVLSDEKWFGWADRIIMPHPYGDANFLSIVFPCLRGGGTINYYDFEKEKGGMEKIIGKIEKQAKECGCEVKITGKRKVRNTAKGIAHFAIDFRASRC